MKKSKLRRVASRGTSPGFGDITGAGDFDSATGGIIGAGLQGGPVGNSSQPANVRARVKIKRAYEPAAQDDGYRVLVDRLWPRGIRKSQLVLDEWAKELAPSTELRKSFGHDPSRWKDFSTRYRFELRGKAAREKIENLAERARRTPVTLIYSARDEEHNDAVVLKTAIEREAKRQVEPGKR